MLHRELRRPEQSLLYHLRYYSLLTDRLDMKFTTEAAACLSNIGFTLAQLERLEDSLVYQLEQLAVVTKIATSQTEVVDCLEDLSATMLRLKKYEDVTAVLERILEFRRKNGDFEGQLRALDQLDTVQQKRQLFKESIRTKKRILELLERSGRSDSPQFWTLFAAIEVAESRVAVIDSVPFLRYNEQLAWTDNCAICLNDWKPQQKVRVLKKCKHKFHQECIDSWLFSDKLTCPYCRAAI